MKVEMVILAFPGKKAESYDTKDEGITDIFVEKDRVRIDFVDQGRNWAREIPISKLRFVEYPIDELRSIREGTVEEENVYKGQEGGEIK